MPSLALEKWHTIRSRQLDELDTAHAAVGGRRPGRRYATQQLNHSYIVAVAAQFQAYCRDLHSEAADVVTEAIIRAGVATSIDTVAIADIAQMALTRNRRLDRGNANPANIAADFNGFDIEILAAVRQRHALAPNRLRALEQLNIWRNAIAHQDFRFTDGQLETLGGRSRVGLTEARAFRRACGHLAKSFDDVLSSHLTAIIRVRPW